MFSRSNMGRGVIPLIGIALILSACITPSAHTNVEWFNQFRLNGITYQTHLGFSDILPNALLGTSFAIVQFTVNDNIDDPYYQLKDGDATYLAKGATIYTVHGYKSTFRLAAYFLNPTKLLYYDVVNNPNAMHGSDLLDISGKVVSISVNGVDYADVKKIISDPHQLQSIIPDILAAPIAPPILINGVQDQQLLIFHLSDGTTAVRTFWPQLRVVEPGIQIPVDIVVLLEQGVINKYEN